VIIEGCYRTVNTDKNAMIHWRNIFNYWYFSLNTDKFIILLIKWLNYWPNPIVTDHQLFYWQFNFFTDHLHLILIKFYWSFIIKYWPFNLYPFFLINEEKNKVWNNKKSLFLRNTEWGRVCAGAWSLIRYDDQAFLLCQFLVHWVFSQK
jgi:hypothetical protein